MVNIRPEGPSLGERLQCGLWLLLLAPLLASCTSYEVEDHSLQFNQAVGSLGNRLLLLNAVRAAKGYPMQFSKLQTYTGQGRADTGVSIDVPFVLDTVGSGPLSPARLVGTARATPGLRSGVQALQLVDLNTAEAQKALRTQVSAKEFEYYWIQGWPPRLLVTIVVEGLEIPEPFFDALAQYYRGHCKAHADKTECSWLRREVEACGGRESLVPTAGIGKFERHDVSYITFGNDVRNMCRYTAFQWFLDALYTGKGALDLPAKRAKKKDDQGQNATYRSDRFAIDVNVKVSEKEAPEAVASHSIDLFFQNRDLEKVYQGLLGKLDSKGTKIDVLEIVFRSPERMVRYLGEVIAAEGFASDPREIRIRSGNEVARLFEVRRGLELPRKAAVAVVGPEGDRYSIPIPDYGSPSKHMSLQAMALVIDFLNSAVSGKALPAPNTLIISGG